MRLFPCVRGKLGTWSYYSTKMTAESLAESVKFAQDVEKGKVLDKIIQRILNESRAKAEIAGYLALQADHFFNAIVIAAWDGKPTFFSIDLKEDPRFDMVADRKFMESFGLLRFVGEQNYYAHYGQHRLCAIRALLNRETDFHAPPGFAKEEFPVILVVPTEGENFSSFLPRYRRLFSNLNRYAKAMDPATIVAMDEDDAIAIITRRLIAEHPFFWWQRDEASRIKVQAGKAIGENENCLLTLVGLYEMNGVLLWSAARAHQQGVTFKEWIKSRPDESEIDALYAELRVIWDAILAELPVLSTDVTTNYRSKRGEDFEREGQTVVNHLLFRPIGQQLLAELIRGMLDNSLPTVPPAEVIRGLNSLEWRLYSAPWRHLLTKYDAAQDCWTMRTDKEAKAVALHLVNFITGVDPLDSAAVDRLRDKWRSLLMNPDPDYVDSAWESVMSASKAYPRR